MFAKCHVACIFAVQRLQAPQSERSRREHDERQQTVGSLRQLRQTTAWRNTQRVEETGLTSSFDPRSNLKRSHNGDEDTQPVQTA